MMRQITAVIVGGVVAIGIGAGPARAQSWGACPANLSQIPRTKCGTIEVFENRAEGKGRRIPIRFALLEAEARTGREPLFAFAGGPGQGSTDLAGLGTGPIASVRKDRDIVLVDQRGTGGSNPLICPVDLINHPELAFGHVFDPAVFRRCRVELERKADLRYYTTELAVEDVDDVRKALGAERIMVWGGSYGTRMAQAYMRAHPDRVVAAVLDGVVPFDFRAPSGYAASLQQSLDRVFADCAAESTCAARHRDLPAAFGRLVDRLRKGPVPATVKPPKGPPAPVSLSFGDFAYSVRGILYSS